MKHNIAAYLLLLVIASLPVTSCQNRSGEVLSRKKMERLMYDVYVAEATMENDYQNFNSPEKKEAYINEVFRAHGVTQARWDTSLSWYSDRIDVYLRMNDSVKARLKRNQAAIDALVAQQNVQQQYDPSSFSPSYIPPYYLFGTPGAGNGFRFRLDSMEIASQVITNQFQFAFRAIGIPPTRNTGLSASLELVYGDTTIYYTRQITENRGYQIRARKYIDGDTITGLNGFVHLQGAGTMPRVQLYDIYLEDERPGSLASPTDTLPSGFIPDTILSPGNTSPGPAMDTMLPADTPRVHLNDDTTARDSTRPRSL